MSSQPSRGLEQEPRQVDLPVGTIPTDVIHVVVLEVPHASSDGTRFGHHPPTLVDRDDVIERSVRDEEGPTCRRNPCGIARLTSPADRRKRPEDVRSATSVDERAESPHRKAGQDDARGIDRVPPAHRGDRCIDVQLGPGEAVRPRTIDGHPDPIRRALREHDDSREALGVCFENGPEPHRKMLSRGAPLPVAMQEHHESRGLRWVVAWRQPNVGAPAAGRHRVLKCLEPPDRRHPPSSQP